MRTRFISLLGEADKAASLRSAINDDDCANVYVLDPERFSAIPGSPFAYWAHDQFVDLFRKLPSFADAGGSAVTGMQTNDNSRWARLLWEYEAEDEDTGLVPFAKGGAHSPFYFETYVGLRWGSDGRALKEWKLDELARGRITANNSKCWNEQFYRRPGITWPMRSKSFAPQPLPAGCIFSIRGSSAFLPEQDLLAALAIFNSRPFDYLYKLMLGRFDYPEFITGVLAKMPWPTPSGDVAERLGNLALKQWILRRRIFLSREVSPVFVLPEKLLARIGVPERDTIEAQSDRLQAEIDSLCCNIFGLGEEARTEMELWSRARQRLEGADEFCDTEGDAVQDAAEPAEGDADAAVLSWCVGVCLGRFDLRIATGARPAELASMPFVPLSRRSPGMRSGGDPVFVENDGMLVDDCGHPLDIVTLIAAVMREIGEIVPDADALRRRLRREFFPTHLKLYSRNLRKAPIYWQLATPSASYSVWLYIHAFSEDTLFRVQNDYVAPKLAHEVRHLESLTSELRDGATAAQRKTVAAQEAVVDELRAFLDEVRRVAPLWKPNLDDGVIINFAPLWRLVPQNRSWQKELKATWDALCEGQYDWAHLAMRLWPERVVPKCAKDRSLAIAHELEDVFWVEGTDGKWTARKAPTRSVDELVFERTSPAVKSALKSLLEAPAAAGKSGGRRGGGRRKSAAAAEGGDA